MCYLKLNNVEASRAALAQAMELNCTVTCLRHLAAIHRKTGDTGAVVAALEDALK